MQERFLHGVLRFVERCQHAVAMNVQFAPVELGDCREGRLVTCDRVIELVGSLHVNYT